jgi:hypothetical protein
MQFGHIRGLLTTRMSCCLICISMFGGKMISLNKQYKYCHIRPFPPKAIRLAEKTDSLFQRILARPLRILRKEKFLNITSLARITRCVDCQEKPLAETLVSNDVCQNNSSNILSPPSKIGARASFQSIDYNFSPLSRSAIPWGMSIILQYYGGEVYET